MLSAYLDGELTADERAAVEARSATSAEWRAELDEVRETRDVLRGLPAVDGASRVLGRGARGRRGRRRSTTPSVRSGVASDRRVAVAGAAAAAVIVIAVVAVPGREPRSVPSPVPRDRSAAVRRDQPTQPGAPRFDDGDPLSSPSPSARSGFRTVIHRDSAC